MMYVNDLTGHDEMLELSGVGRATLGEDEEEKLSPGALVRRVPGHRFEIEAGPEVAHSHMLIFIENGRGGDSYEFVVK